MKILSSTIIGVLAGITLASNAFAATIWDDYVNLKPKIDKAFPSYTASDRIGVVTAVQKMMKIYVNRESKIQHYGIDPIPIFDDIAAKATNLTNAEFHTDMQNTYSALRDLHTNYYNPKPYQCYYCVWPLYFTPVHTSAEDIVANVSVRVSGFSTYPQVLNRYPGIKTKVSIGDELVTFNGLTVPEFVEAHARNVAGANSFGGLRRVLQGYSLRSGYYKILPNETNVEYVLKTRSGRHYTISGNITSYYTESCVGTTSTSSTSGDDTTTERTQEKVYSGKLPTLDSSVSSTSKLPVSVNEEFQEVYNAFDHQDLGVVYTAVDDILSYAYYQRQVSTVGLIRLSSFSPSDGNIDRVIKSIRSLLVNEFKDTNAILFDLRDNGGGYISLADEIPQLFKNDIYPTGARAIVHPYNQEIYKNLGGDWAAAYSEVKEGDKYTRTVTFTSFDLANQYGVAYLKPVGLLTNGNCFSACELFSANMQDWAAATVIGEDGTTGGGGANVVTYTSYFRTYFPSIFASLPSAARTAGQDMRLGWRQTVRNGKYDGQLIEDIGVESDVVVRPSVGDLSKNSTQNTWQLDRSTEYLLNLGRDNHTIHLSFFTDIGLDIFLPSDGNLTITGTSSKLNSVAIFDSNGKQFGSAKLGYTTDPAAFTFKTLAPPSLGAKIYTLTGYRDGAAVFSTKRTISHPDKKNFLTPTAGSTITWDFTTSNYAIISNQHTSDADGFNIVTLSNGQKAVKIGDGSSYADNLDSSVSFLIKVPSDSAELVITISGTVDVETDYDYLYGTVTGVNSTSDTFAITGSSTVEDGTGSTSEYAGQYVEVSVRFKSDSNTSSAGITLTKIAISV